VALNNCIENFLKEKRISEKYAKNAEKIYNERFNYIKATTGETDEFVSAQATTQTLDELERQQIHAKYKIIRQQAVQRQIIDNFNSYNEGKDFGKAAQALIEQDEVSNYSNLQYRRRAIHGTLLSKMEDSLAAFGRRGIFGQQQNKPLMREMVRAIFDEDSVSNPLAKEMAKAWKETSDYARLLFNKAGGSIPKRADWGMSQIHDSVAIEKASFEKWYDFIKDRLDYNKLYSERTGSLIQGEANIKEALQETYDAIVSDGWSQIKPSGAIRGAALANRRLDHRFLTFKNADSWIEYQEMFGDPNAFNNMMGHLDHMSRDIATMQILGPNPNATINFIEGLIKKNTTIGKESQGAAKSKIDKFKTMYDIYTGQDQIPANGKAARVLKSTRSLLQAAQLGSAALAALGDFNTQRITAKMNGLPVMKLYSRILKNLNPLKAEENTRLALRLGLIADNWISAGSVQQRYFGEVSGPELAGRVSDTVMRVSGLSAWTQANRFAFGMEFMGHLADSTGKQFDELDAPLQMVLRRYGLDGDKWDLMRRTELYKHEGTTFLRPDDMREAHPELSLRFLEMVNRETDFAVPTTSIKTKAILSGGTQPGTFMGEIAKSASMYKNYAVTLLGNNMTRIVTQKEINNVFMGMKIPTAAARALQATDLVIGATVMGGIALQLKEISKGRNPREVDTPQFLGAALLQGGALSLFGDFLSSSTNRYGGGLAETVAGPVVGLVGDLSKLTIGNITELAQGKDTNFVKEFTRFTGRYTPGQSIWYLNLAFKRLALEQMEQWGDPKARQRYSKQMQKYRRETGQDYWWNPGETSPKEAPQITPEKLLSK
jgi:hypothetical protein